MGFMKNWNTMSRALKLEIEATEMWKKVYNICTYKA